MLAVILNSGMGTRMGGMTEESPKCFVRLADGRTILERQLRLLAEAGVRDVLITTGPFPGLIEDFTARHFPALNAAFVRNDRYAETNYIYSLYLARDRLDTDILLMHGDLVFSGDVLAQVMACGESCMVCDSTLPLPEKDFKAVTDGARIAKVGVEFFHSAVAAQPLYKLLRKDWAVWREAITGFCEAGQVRVYAENAFNGVSDRCAIRPLDVCGGFCREVDDPADLEAVNNQLEALRI